MGNQEQLQFAPMLIREHANGCVAQIEASEVAGKWHVAAYSIDGGAPTIPVTGYVAGQAEAMQLADHLVQDHAPHRCHECGPWRRTDDQRLSSDAVSLDSAP